MRSVSFVLYVIDELTNKPVGRGQVRAVIEAEAVYLPVYKEGGWICFLDLPVGVHTVALDGPLYQRQRVTVNIEHMPKTDDLSGSAGHAAGCPVITVRMQPGKTYPLLSNCACIFGQAPPGANVRAIFKPEGSPLRLLQDYKDGRLIRIFSAELKMLDGRSFILDEKECFTIARTIDENERVYLMERPLKKAYKKSGTKICLTAQTCADENGKFRFVFRCFGQKSIHCTIEISENGHRSEEFEVSAGEKTVVMLYK